MLSLSVGAYVQHIDLRSAACTEQIEYEFAGWPRADRHAPLRAL